MQREQVLELIKKLREQYRDDHADASPSCPQCNKKMLLDRIDRDSRVWYCHCGYPHLHVTKRSSNDPDVIQLCDQIERLLNPFSTDKDYEKYCDEHHIAKHDR
jgi:ribosomal protein L37AE/L43A